MDGRNNRNADRRGAMVPVGRDWRIDNALVEEVRARNDRNGYILVSYAARGANNMTYIELLRLNVGRNTVIRTRNGRRLGLRDIRPGMFIDTEFSGAMTRSIPPQANAYRITADAREQTTLPGGRRTTMAPIVSVDALNNSLLVGDREDVSDQIRLTVSSNTRILNRAGRPIPLRHLSPGRWVHVIHADFMTMSIPPQTAAYRIQLL
ncbi:MAG: hypothetical protein PHZ09_06360 [Eubacteriales bacterium]|jgi:hypothetical protein|nr:hypothetical protein [Eubacteriales bacterium]